MPEQPRLFKVEAVLINGAQVVWDRCSIPVVSDLGTYNFVAKGGTLNVSLPLHSVLVLAYQDTEQKTIEVVNSVLNGAGRN